MGKRGPKPHPSKLRVLHGDKPLHEPVPATAEVKCPAWLPAPARSVWRALAPDLVRQGVLTHWDVPAFTVFCDAVARHREAAEIVARDGVLVDGYRGSKVKNPACQLVRAYAGIVSSLGARFGLTPSDRAQLSIEPPESEVRHAERLLS